MILRALITAALLFLLYNLVLVVRPRPGCFKTQSQWQENVAQAQEFALGASPRPAVLVGSSLGARLLGTRLDANFVNLSFSGEGPATGLEIVRRASVAPPLVVIEMNFVLREPNETIVGNVFAPVVAPLRRHLPALRERYQPANVVAGYVGARVVRDTVTMARRLHLAPALAADTGAGVSPELYAQLVAEQRSRFDHLADAEELKSGLTRLRHAVAELEQRGTRCVFLEMPIDPALGELPLPRQVRAQMMRAFPPDRYTWIRPAVARTYVTVDGLHLPAGEAATCAAVIVSELARSDPPKSIAAH